GLGNPQETAKGNMSRWVPQRLYGSGLRCPRYSPASNPARAGGPGNLMLEAKQRAAGSSPAGGTFRIG
ncbi:MAG: hypothetical protein ACREBC_11655, partial [Pyrinomonadaceae bacterium]